LHRSKTAEYIFKDRFETRSAGLFNEKPVSDEEISWADVVIVMEDFQIREIAKRFPELYLQKKIISLDIQDIYFYQQPQLIDVLERKMKALFEPFIE